jgi:prophage DNA circulation protein
MSTTSDFAAAAQGLAAALLGATVNPADAVRLLSSLADFTPNGATSSAPVGIAMATMQKASGDLFRRAAVVALARASATYQPFSADDAAGLRDVVCGLLDKEIMLAGDQGQDATFNALRAVRAAVAHDLSARGAALAGIVTVESNQPVPAPVLAQRLYRDAARADELVTQANSPHPAFMPTNFKALAT